VRAQSVLRGYLQAGLEDVALWHERDISHSSVERVVLPDALQLTVYMLRKATGLANGLVLHPERALENLTTGSLGLVFSQSVLLASSIPECRATTPTASCKRPPGAQLMSVAISERSSRVTTT